MNAPNWRDAYALVSSDKLRYGDTDRQGHVNNAVFATFLETGRVEFLYDPRRPLARDGAEFVLVSLKVDLEGEVSWPGRVEVGTRVTRVGTSSFTLEQVVYQEDRRVATAESVVVQIDRDTRKSAPLAPTTVDRLEELKSP
jgi:acyl-CoA thioester hydrolase